MNEQLVDHRKAIELARIDADKAEQQIARADGKAVALGSTVTLLGIVLGFGAEVHTLPLMAKVMVIVPIAITIIAAAIAILPRTKGLPYPLSADEVYKGLVERTSDDVIELDRLSFQIFRLWEIVRAKNRWLIGGFSTLPVAVIATAATVMVD